MEELIITLQISITGERRMKLIHKKKILLFHMSHGFMAELLKRFVFIRSDSGPAQCKKLHLGPHLLETLAAVLKAWLFKVMQTLTMQRKRGKQ